MSAKRSSQTDNKVKDIASTTFVSLDEDTLVAEAARTLYEQESCTIMLLIMIPLRGKEAPLE